MKHLNQFITEYIVKKKLDKFIDSEEHYKYFPKTKDELIENIEELISKDIYDLNTIDVSKITDMSDLFKNLNCNYHIIHNNPNGKNINENCGSTHIESLKKYVIDNSLDCGIAYDGDADRCIMIDNNGNEIDGDYILAILANDLLKHNKLNNNTLVGTVMSNLGLTKFCEKNNINFVATKVGDRYVLEEMLKEGYNIGGEQSGHIILKDFANTGDGELTSIKILEIMKKENKSLEDLKKVMTKYPQILINVKVDNNKKHLLESDIEINECIKKLEGILNNDGRILIRPSGTEPLIRVMLEGSNIDKIKEYAYNIAKIIEDKLN